MEKKIKYRFPVKEVTKKADNNFSNLEKTFIIGSENRDDNQYGEIDTSEDKYYQFVYTDGTGKDTSWYVDSDTIKELTG